jgi:hypothetical protein
MIQVREVRLDDLPVVAEMMHTYLDPFYGGDHRAHAKRIVETASMGSKDAKGHFSAEQLMYVAVDDEDGNIVGILNFVSKYQGTVKISPLIVREEARGKVSVACFFKNSMSTRRGIGSDRFTALSRRKTRLP